MFISAPYIKIDASLAVNAGDVQIEYTVAYQGEHDDYIEIKKNQTIRLSTQKVNVTMSPSGEKKMIKDRTTTQLDDILMIDGPIVRIEPITSPGATISTRLSPSDQFKTLTLTFDRTLIARDVVLGYKDNTLYLVKDNKVLI